jgi:PAS domain S-box-containing protein
MEMSREVSISTENLLDLLWNSSLCGMILIKPDGEIIRVNDAYKKIYAIDRDITGESFWSIFPDEVKEEIKRQFKLLFNSNKLASQLDSIFKIYHVEEKFLEFRFFFLTENQERKAMLWLVEDVTSQKLATLEIQRAKERIEESDRLKAAFLANMSHEIRTPMNGIIGFSSMLLDPDLSDDKRGQFVEIIISSSNHLLELIDDIIDLSKIEARQVELNNREFYLNDLMNEVYASFGSTAASKGIRFTFHMGLPMPESKIISDEKKLKQVITNLINNAFKFTHEGVIEFGYSIVGKEIQFMVRDTGIGIDAKYYKTIFERFRQADDSNTRQYGGTGLGLSISKSYIELIGGRIWVQSKLNEGSSFYFTVPYHPAKMAEIIEEKATASGLPDWSGKTILIAEDEEVNHIYLSEVLLGTNVNVLSAKNGLEAVDIARKDRDIDIILMDIKMPELNGYEATKIIKQIRPTLPIIAQTAYAMAGDREIALSEGCDDYISKPVKKDKLLSIIQKYI